MSVNRGKAVFMRATVAFFSIFFLLLPFSFPKVVPFFLFSFFFLLYFAEKKEGKEKKKKKKSS